MALDSSKLEKVSRRNDRIIARCPACAEAGGDTKGEHLIVYPDGRFGCALYPGDNEHRRRIWQLAGAGRSSAQQTPRKRLIRETPETPLPSNFHDLARKARMNVYASPDVQRHIAREFGVSPDIIKELAAPDGGAIGFSPNPDWAGKKFLADRIAYIYPKGIKFRHPWGPDKRPRFVWACGRPTEPWRYSLAARRKGTTRFIITEGESDLIALVEAGRGMLAPHSTEAIVASPGTSFRSEWASLFSGLEVIVAFDADEAGRSWARKVADLIARHTPNVKIFNLPIFA